MTDYRNTVRVYSPMFGNLEIDKIDIVNFKIPQQPKNLKRWAYMKGVAAGNDVWLSLDEPSVIVPVEDARRLLKEQTEEDLSTFDW